MKSSKLLRNISVVASAALLLGAFVAGPADAKKKKCPRYKTPSWAEGAETTVVTDKATADAPIELTIATEPGLGFTSSDDPGGGTGAPSAAYHNIVVDTAKASAKLFVRIEFLQPWDYDLYLRGPDAVAYAYEADFNPLTANGPTGVGANEGAHPEVGASQIDGYSSLDCTGFTSEIAGGTTAGGDVVAKIWLEQ